MTAKTKLVIPPMPDGPSLFYTASGVHDWPTHMQAIAVWGEQGWEAAQAQARRADEAEHKYNELRLDIEEWHPIGQCAQDVHDARAERDATQAEVEALKAEVEELRSSGQMNLNTKNAISAEEQRQRERADSSELRLADIRTLIRANRIYNAVPGADFSEAMMFVLDR